MNTTEPQTKPAIVLVHLPAETTALMAATRPAP
jgi:hypothetical protein